AHAHKGASFVEIFQNCIVYNDGVFAPFAEKATAAETQLLLEHGKPMIWGKARNKALRLNRETLALEVVTLGENGVTEADVLIHDETNRTIAHLLVEMEFPAFPVALGVIYCDPAPTYEAAMAAQDTEQASW